MNTEKKARDDEELLNRVLQTGKTSILRVVLGRTTVVIVLLALQLLLLFSFFRFLERYVPIYFGSMIVISAFMLMHLLNTPGNPSIKLTWCALIALAPVVGTLFYWFIQMDVGHRQEQSELQKMEHEAAAYALPQTELMEQLKRKDPQLYHLATYTRKYGDYCVYANTSVTYFKSGEEKFEEMLRQIRKAKKFIFLEYFSIEKGELWTELLSLLTEKVREGVEVRLLYDGTSSMFALPYRYPEALEQLGIHCKVFAPIKPFVTTRHNNRDHRKIMVVDGKAAMTGGVNLSDQYINRKVLYGHWKDAAVLLEGEAVRSFTLMFLKMWNTPGAKNSYSPYLPAFTPAEHPRGYVLPYADSPLDEEQVGKRVYLDIINQAEKYVYIMTPYLILDDEFISALCYAAKRGIDVRLILPHVPDKKYAFALAKTHYKELTCAGVHLFEYTPGFVHSKVFLSDDRRGVVGTINLDYRSLYLHFECAAYLHEVPALADIKADYLATLEQCQRVTEESIREERFSVRIAGVLLKIIAPLM